MRHKHADLIHAWAEGAEIELRNGDAEWVAVDMPVWNKGVAYRIKPEKKPDVVRYGVATIGGRLATVAHLGPCDTRDDNNLKLTFSGETGELIKAEVLK